MDSPIKTLTVSEIRSLSKAYFRKYPRPITKARAPILFNTFPPTKTSNSFFVKDFFTGINSSSRSPAPFCFMAVSENNYSPNEIGGIVSVLEIIGVGTDIVFFSGGMLFWVSVLDC